MAPYKGTQSVQKQFLFTIVLGVFLMLINDRLLAQGNVIPNPTPGTDGISNPTDTVNKNNAKKWDNTSVHIKWRKANQESWNAVDSSIHFINRRALTPGWYKDQGNVGSPTYDLRFQPENRFGPTLGYHLLNPSRYLMDSVRYYNTTNPYSIFNYELGAKQVQIAEIMHSRNIKPHWNFTARYRKVSAPGMYAIQRNNHDNTSLSMNYEDPKLHYKSEGAFIYNKVQHDENGGIINDSFLVSPRYNERTLIPTNFQNDAFSTTRSSVSNVLRDAQLLYRQSYTIGNKDTTYNSDSTAIDVKLLPRFKIMHVLHVHSEKYKYGDLRPDSLRYRDLFARSFLQNDSVKSEQNWLKIDNRFSISGFFGNINNPIAFEAGTGIRYDRFNTKAPDKLLKESSMNNSLFGSLYKEAKSPRAWDLRAEAEFFYSGRSASDTRILASISKGLSEKLGRLELHAWQNINSMPYNYSVYMNNYFTFQQPNNTKESITTVGGKWINQHSRFQIILNNYAIHNYFFVDEKLSLTQHNQLMNLLQLEASKKFKIGNWFLDNLVLFQQTDQASPIKVPLFAGRHQIYYSDKIFKNALEIATGVAVKYHTKFTPYGYSPLLHRLTAQNSYTATNIPQIDAFFNFQIKHRFKCTIAFEQLNQLIDRNIIYTPGYPDQNFNFRFGFSWILIN